MNKITLKNIKALHSRMSWVLLEYNIIYFLKSDFADKFTIHESWIKLRTIPDFEYDKKWYFYLELSMVMGFDFKNEVSFDPNRPSSQLILNKMQSSVQNPILWPNEAEQFYIHYLLLSHYLKKRKLKKVS